MRLLKTTVAAGKALLRNPMRSALTSLVIVICVSLVIATFAIVEGGSRANEATVARMGTNNLMIQPGTAASGGVSFGSGTSLTLTVQDAEVLAAECGDVLDGVAPVVRTRTQVVYGNKNWVPAYLYGTTPSFLGVREWELSEGYEFTDQDVRNGTQVCILGQTLVREMFGNESPLDQEVRINNQPFKVIGVLGPKGANSMGMDQDDILIAPWTAIKFKVAGSSVTNVNQSAAEKVDTSQQVNTLSQKYPNQERILYPQASPAQKANYKVIDRHTNVDVIWVRVADRDDIPMAKKRITDTLRRQHRLRADQDADFNIRDMTEQIAVQQAQAKLMGVLLVSVASVPMIGGGVCIMIVMLIAVTERTREIGLRMAVGATRQDIMYQFLTEAVVVCVVGAVLGVALGSLGALVVWWQLNWNAEVSPTAVLMSVSVSVVVGVIFGFYPAWKASRLDPIQALRYE